MSYIKYQHVEKFGNCEVEGLVEGEVYVFPKIDGTNAQVWYNEGMHYGSRNRELSLENDNAGFMRWAIDQEKLDIAISRLPSGYRLYGEWLVPHSLKTYREGAWREFYVFDVVNEDGDYMPYDVYQPILSLYGVECIPPLCVITNPTYEDILRVVEENTYLITEGTGEGVVLKRYGYTNKYGRTTWAKVVTTAFKDPHSNAPVTKGSDMVEEAISEMLSEEVIRKVYANICSEMDGWSSKYIGRLLSTIWHDFIAEEMWNAIKKHKNPTINFKLLNRFVMVRVKSVLVEVF